VDARFGAGRATVPTIQDTHATPTGLAVLPDGRAVVAYVRSWGTDPQGIATFGYVARFGADGALDRSFGAYGEASIPQNDPRAESPLTVDGFDRVLVLGNRWPSLQYGSWDVVITRLTRYGGGDPTFGLLGTADTGFGDGQTGVALLVDSDGGSVVAGSDPARGVFIARFAGDRIYARAEGETLTITGTPAGEVIRARVRGGLIEVDGVGETFAAGQFSRVRVEAWGGDDVVDLAALTLPAIVVAGDGRDVIFGGSAADFLAGGAGDDPLFGGRGADTLRGETGNDYLNGGRGADWVFADAGNDQIFAADATIDTIYGGVGFDRVKADTEDVLQDTEGLLA
jgi:Ca2+-binding RTX toxin-like protein